MLSALPDFVSYSKLRVSYTEVGNSIPAFISTPAQYTLSSGFLNLNLTKPLATLKPELTHSFEAGMEWRFLNDHITFDATYYHTNSYNQLFNIATSTASGGFSTQYINGGNVKNEGIEGSLGYRGNIAHGFSWTSNFTFSMNKNKVVALYTDPVAGPQTQFVFPNAVNAYQIEARVGKPFGEIYLNDFVRDANGKIVLNGGMPSLIGGNGNDYVDAGNANPNFMLGWTNTFKLQQFDLAFTVDGRFGGKTVDMTQAYMDAYGVSPASAAARDAGGVNIDGTKIDPQAYYNLVGGRSGALTQYVYSATNIRSVSYTHL